MQDKTLTRVVLGLISVIAVLVAMLWVVHGSLPDDRKPDFVLQVADGVVSLLLVVIFGGAVSLGLKSFEKRRDRRRALQQYRSDFLRDFLRAYHSSKTCRRNLSRDGLTVKCKPWPKQLSAVQLTAFSTEMTALNVAQLDIERLVAEVRSFPAAFRAEKVLEKYLHKMESYLREVLREFEIRWSGIRDGGGFSFDDFDQLADFTGKFDKSRYKSEFLHAKDNALMLLRDDLLPSPNL